MKKREPANILLMLVNNRTVLQKLTFIDVGSFPAALLSNRVCEMLVSLGVKDSSIIHDKKPC